jgi:short-subunit dehydrogenase
MVSERQEDLEAALDRYEAKFKAEPEIQSFDIPDDEFIERLEQAVASGKPLADDLPEGAVI